MRCRSGDALGTAARITDLRPIEALEPHALGADAYSVAIDDMDTWIAAGGGNGPCGPIALLCQKRGTFPASW